MKKNDLKNGMVVEIRNGRRYLLVGDTFIEDKYHIDLVNFADDLTCCLFEEFDIMAVFKAQLLGWDNIFKDENLKCIWERKEITPEEELEKFLIDVCDAPYCRRNITCTECRAKSILENKDHIMKIFNSVKK